MKNRHSAPATELASRPARLILEDGTVFKGFGEAGSPATTIAELVFNTALTGYEEVLTDPSYRGQFVAFTTPHLGTTGWTERECEHLKMTISGVVCRKLSTTFDNNLGLLSLPEALKREGIPWISGVDTRALTLLLRKQGTMNAVLEISDSFGPEDWASGGVPEWLRPCDMFPTAAFPEGGYFFSSSDQERLSVLLVDFGVKSSILRHLQNRGADVTVIPWQSLEHAQWPQNLDGVVFSNGPGDPRTMLERPGCLARIRELSEKFPCFGICFGHQALALAFGARIEKLPFGHHALNHPVAEVSKNGEIQQVFITSQNHNYAVVREGMPSCLEVTHLHLGDGSIAGLRLSGRKTLSVQFHPEAGPGPRESQSLFEDFFAMMKERT